mmetsp:Transcript_8821/g.26439  ORF Transcript_8821/g.26439 Transcript_8821/m.26439 type:complete len:91 (-) Transcript_8821:3172-3444(-)
MMETLRRSKEYLTSRTQHCILTLLCAPDLSYRKARNGISKPLCKINGVMSRSLCVSGSSQSLPKEKHGHFWYHALVFSRSKIVLQAHLLR